MTVVLGGNCEGHPLILHLPDRTFTPGPVLVEPGELKPAGRQIRHQMQSIAKRTIPREAALQCRPDVVHPPCGGTSGLGGLRIQIGLRYPTSTESGMATSYGGAFAIRREFFAGIGARRVQQTKKNRITPDIDRNE